MADGVVVLLDYWKFFDSFAYDIVEGLMKTLGFESGLVDFIICLLHAVLSNSRVGTVIPSGKAMGWVKGIRSLC